MDGACVSGVIYPASHCGGPGQGGNAGIGGDGGSGGDGGFVWVVTLTGTGVCQIDASNVSLAGGSAGIGGAGTTAGTDGTAGTNGTAYTFCTSDACTIACSPTMGYTDEYLNYCCSPIQAFQLLAKCDTYYGTGTDAHGAYTEYHLSTDVNLIVKKYADELLSADLIVTAATCTTPGVNSHVSYCTTFTKSNCWPTFWAYGGYAGTPADFLPSSHGIGWPVGGSPYTAWFDFSTNPPTLGYQYPTGYSAICTIANCPSGSGSGGGGVPAPPSTYGNDGNNGDGTHTPDFETQTEFDVALDPRSPVVKNNNSFGSGGSGNISIDNNASAISSIKGDFTETDATLVPNPASSTITLNFVAAIGMGYEVEIIDLNGKRAFEGIISVTPGPNSYKTDVSNFAPGEYIVTICHAGKQQQIKFIKQ